ncbi:MAG: DJ-1/PfpI family protein [Phycisphaerales bacterium]|nr:MAG: DJ-1/PfpI family protein [Phycisphaerales bacterium]
MKRVLVVLPNGFEVFEAAAFVDVLGWAGEYGSDRIDVTTAGLSSEVSCTFGGFRVIPDAQLSECNVEDFDAVAIPGGFETAGFYEEAFSEPVLGILRAFGEHEKPVASICVGALPVAKSGILEGRRATTYHLSDGHRRKQLAALGVEVIDERLVVDGNVITSTSPATAIDVALELVKMLTSSGNAARIRHLMGFE